MIEKIKVSTKQRVQMIDITAQIQELINKKKTGDGIASVFCPHTTAAITINENADPSVQSDINETLNSLVPHHTRYAHTEGNADAHVKSAVMGSSRTVFVEKGKLSLGTWQGIFFCEFDGPRTREVWVKISQT
ncbi:MAG: secondary thiamine-phosphate synthase enzyme YjbQ [candidate division WOR-3 bacterium]|jgi:secondary thiamine-phosphate synthase enzyme